MRLSETIRTIARARRDAARAEELYADPAFRMGLRRDPEGALRMFTVTSVPARAQGRRETPRAWLLRVDVSRRPVL